MSDVLSRYAEAKMLLQEDTGETSARILAFYLPCFSTDVDQKAKEEMIVYNFNCFVKRVESQYKLIIMSPPPPPAGDI